MKLYLLPVLAALALTGSVFSIPPADASASPAPTAGPTQTIYAGTLKNNWQYWGWANSNFSNKAPALSATSIKIQAGGWQALYLHHVPFQTTSLMYVSFWINGGPTGGQSLVVKGLRSGVPQKSVAIGTLKANVWQQVLIALPKLGVGAVPDMEGLWIQNNTPNTLAPFYVDQISLITASTTSVPLNPVAPAVPTGLTATPKWTTSCPTCGGMAMAHVILSWNAVSGATSYSCYRNGIKVATSLTTPTWTDMGVTSGQAYTYSVTASGPGGESVPSASVSVTAPSPPVSAESFTAPVNLRVQGIWQNGSTDKLAWNPVPGAVSYNIYQYGTQIAAGLKATSYTLPESVFYSGMTYTVTAVDNMGMESLPSAVSCAQGMNDPSQQPSWMSTATVVPLGLCAVPEWNGGLPRIHLFWKGAGANYTYNVYRDGQQVAVGLWGLNYFDTGLQPGESHTYTVTGVVLPWTQAIESEQSLPVSATALRSAPKPQTSPVQITGVQSNDDGAVISFNAVPGAVDYRVYDAAKPDSVKYSGGGLSIEMNGLDPVAGADLIVEAVDKFGPFQTMDGMAGPGAMQMDGVHSAINGQGDPSNIPIVLAASAPYHVTCTPRVLTGSQVFFDTFRNELPLKQQPLPNVQMGDFYGAPGQYAEYANDKWAIRNYGGDIADSAVFFMGNHFMDTLYDGGTPHTGDPMHNNNASLVMMPKATADISGGRVMHVTFEVDPHFDSRRWCDLQIGAAGDTLINPGKIVTGSGPNLFPTLSGTILRWRIDNQFHELSLFENTGTATAPNITETDMIDESYDSGNERCGPAARTAWDGTPVMNGTLQDLDKRHRFDLYLSQTHYRLMECGKVIKDADFPAGATLPFSQCQAYFIHQLYHTANDRGELLDYLPENTYWYNNRPWSDERHWDNMGEEVLTSFPALP